MNPMTVTIRPMQADDLEQVVAIDRLSFSLPWPESAFRYELMENKHARLWVASMTDAAGSEKIVGAVVVWIIVDQAHIATLAVHPEFRRMGVGQQLLIAVLQDALLSGMATATLEVRRGNLAAQALYRKFGFEVVGYRPRYYKDNQEDALIMTVELQHVSADRLLGGSGSGSPTCTQHEPLTERRDRV